MKIRLRLRAARHGRSMEEEARVILRTALAEKSETVNLADLVSSLFGARHGAELPEHPAVRPRTPIK